MSSTGETGAPRLPGTVHLVWNEYREWARFSRSLKQKQTRARNVAAICAVVGAALAATVAQLPEAHLLAKAIAGASAALVAVSTYLGREIVKPDTELRWTKARSLAEALKRECWLFLVGAPPYDGTNATTTLSERAGSLRQNSGLTALGSAGGPRAEIPPEVKGIDDYVSKRLDEQIGWYEERARQFTSKAAFWKKLGYVLGAVATLFGGATSFGWELPGQLTAWVPVVTTATGAIGSFLHAGRFEALIATYRDTARQLRYRGVRFQELQEKNRETELQLVADCESIMASENDAWRVEWRSSEA